MVRTRTAGPVAVLLLLMGLIASPAVAENEKVLVIADFDDNIQNSLGGYYNKFEAGGSTASTFLSAEVFRGRGGRSLRLVTDRARDGFCGWWMHLFDFRADEVKYFDARPYRYLSFWVKGENGGETFSINLADERYVRLEDSVPLGNVERYLPGGVTTHWKEVLVPLKDVKGLDLGKLGGITLDFTTPGKRTLYIDDVSFKTVANTRTPMTRDSSATTQPTVQKPRAMWVWHTPMLLGSADERQKLFEFCGEHNINMLWMQIPYSFTPEVDLADPDLAGKIPEDVRCDIQNPEAMRAFLKQAHEHGVAVHGLEGYPEFAQRAYHALPLAVVDAVIRFNRETEEPAERYDGVHFDNEPYLLVGWQDAARRVEILEDFLVLIAECQRRADGEPGLEFGVDIPFWWHAKDPETGKPTGGATYNGVYKPASHHCVDLLDNVGIMNYRDTADGADGMIAHGSDPLAYSDETGGAKIYMGVETFAYPPTDIWFAVGLPNEVFKQVQQTPAGSLTLLSRVEGFRIHTLRDGVRVHVGIELPQNPSETQEAQAAATLAMIATRVGASAKAEYRNTVDAARHTVRQVVGRNAQWSNARDRDIPGKPDGEPFAGFVLERLMPPKVTFGDNTYEDVVMQTAAADAYFQRFKSYEGFAIHYYTTFRAMIEASRAAACEKAGADKACCKKAKKAEIEKE